MKKLFLLLMIMLITTFTLTAQNCIRVVTASFINPSNDNITWFVTINWEAAGRKHMEVTIKNGATVYPTECFESNASTGTQVYGPYITTGGMSNLEAAFERFTGGCNSSGTSCGTVQLLHIGGFLPIKFGNINAQNVGNNTVITFQAESTSMNDELVINYNMPNGSVKKFKILLTEQLFMQDVWEITINNITKAYTIKRK